MFLGTAVPSRAIMCSVVSPAIPALMMVTSTPRTRSIASSCAGYAWFGDTPAPAVLLAPSATIVAAWANATWMSSPNTAVDTKKLDFQCIVAAFVLAVVPSTSRTNAPYAGLDGRDLGSVCHACSSASLGRTYSSKYPQETCCSIGKVLVHAESSQIWQSRMAQLRVSMFIIVRSSLNRASAAHLKSLRASCPVRYEATARADAGRLLESSPLPYFARLLVLDVGESPVHVKGLIKPPCVQPVGFVCTSLRALIAARLRELGLENAMSAWLARLCHRGSSGEP